MLNVVTIHAIRKTVSLPKPLKTFLLSLGISDLGVGLFVLPLYIGHLVMKLEQNTESNSTFNTISSAYQTTAYLFTFASFFGVVALSADRFLGDVAAVVRSSTISPLNNRTNKRNKERGIKTVELLHIAVQ